jgi:hypothetical protein
LVIVLEELKLRNLVLYLEFEWEEVIVRVSLVVIELLALVIFPAFDLGVLGAKSVANCYRKFSQKFSQIVLIHEQREKVFFVSNLTKLGLMEHDHLVCLESWIVADGYYERLERTL